MMKLTIVTVVFNDCRNISKTIESVLRHKTTDIEYIIIDGWSTDGTIEKVENYKNQIEFFISEKDNGIYDAMNKGLKLASGESIFFLNSGDIFHHDFNLASIFTRYNLSKDVIIGFSVQQYKGDTYLRPSVSNTQHLIRYPAHQAVFVPKKCYKSVDFNERMKIAADYYWIKDVIKMANYEITEQIISVFALGGKSTSRNFKDIYLLNDEMKVEYKLAKSILKFLLFNILGRKLSFRLLYKGNYTRLS